MPYFTICRVELFLTNYQERLKNRPNKERGQVFSLQMKTYFPAELSLFDGVAASGVDLAVSGFAYWNTARYFSL